MLLRKVDLRGFVQSHAGNTGGVTLLESLIYVSVKSEGCIRLFDRVQNTMVGAIGDCNAGLLRPAIRPLVTNLSQASFFGLEGMQMYVMLLFFYAYTQIAAYSLKFNLICEVFSTKVFDEK